MARTASLRARYRRPKPEKIKYSSEEVSETLGKWRAVAHGGVKDKDECQELERLTQSIDSYCSNFDGYQIDSTPVYDALSLFQRRLELGGFVGPGFKDELSVALGNAEDILHRLQHAYDLCKCTENQITPVVPVSESRVKVRHKDGPERPHWLWWKGKQYKIGPKGGGLLHRLLTYFWNSRSGTALFQDLQGDGLPWSYEAGHRAIITAVNRLNAELKLVPEFPWKLETRDGCVFRSPP